MAASKFDPLWQLMSQHSFEVDPSNSAEDLTCIICNKLMVDACQSVCGCQYCHECIRGYMTGGGDKYCPGNREECNEEYLVLERDVTRNMRTSSRISKLRVKCPNIGCQERKELIEMWNHLRVCTELSVECPYTKVGCTNEGGSGDVIEGHLEAERSNHTRLLIEYIDTLKNELNELKEKFEKKIKRDEDDRSSLLNNVCRFCINKSVDFLWKIEQVSVKVTSNYFVSRPFVSYNYKLHLLFRIWQDSVNIDCVVMGDEVDKKGSCDQGLLITISILDQYSLNDYKKETIPFTAYSRRRSTVDYMDIANPRELVNQPKNEDIYNPIGCYSFISYSSIKDNPSVVLGDSIILYCVLSERG